MPRVLKQETVVLLQPLTLVFLPKWSPMGTFHTSKETPQIRAPRRRAGTLISGNAPQTFKNDSQVPNVLLRLPTYFRGPKTVFRKSTLYLQN